MALAQMDLGPASIVWDIGAGSGSVSIEAAQIARRGTVYAVEMDPDDHQLISANAERFGIKNLVPVLGRRRMPGARCPIPISIFVGGSGREINRLVDLASGGCGLAGGWWPTSAASKTWRRFTTRSTGTCRMCRYG